MCGRTSLFVPPSVVEERFDAEFGAEYVPRYNVAPRQDLYAITRESPATVDAFQWGLLPGFVDDPDDSPRPINARAETLAETPYFREAVASRRCLALADGFYEWKGSRGSTQPYRIQRTDEQPFAFAGLRETWRPDGDAEGADAGRGGSGADGASAADEDGDTGETVRSLAIVTTAANEVVAPIHDRMPVILGESEEEAWLEDGERAGLAPIESGRLEASPVSTAVNDPANDTAAVTEPLESEQSGFEEFTD
jgi:putative SOS response-associated peptidase YedK